MKKWMLAVAPPGSRSGLLFTAVFLGLLFFIGQQICFAQKNSSTDAFAAGLGKKSGLSVIDLSSGKEIYAFQSERLLAPASTLKLVTSIVALKNLGAEFKFKTGVYSLQAKKNEVTVGIKGGGDPELTTEQAYLIARKIKLSGLKNITKLLLDNSALKDPSLIQGERAYEAASSALSFNFNSTGVQICPSRDNLKGKAVILPLIWEGLVEVEGEVKQVRGEESNLSLSWVSPKLIKVSGYIGAESSCQIRYLSNQDSSHSFANFIGNALEDLGIASGISTSKGIIPENLPKLFEFESKPLSQLLVGLNHFSTNVSAEQILAAIGSFGETGDLSRSRGLKELNQFIAELGFKDHQIVDGSGLSRKNQLSAKSLSSALSFAWRRPEIGSYVQVSLPVLGQSGTLKRRNNPKGDYQVFAKSGTLDGVSTLAGYLHLCPSATFSCKSYAFSIIQNDIAEISSAHRIEEMILEEVAGRLSN